MVERDHRRGSARGEREHQDHQQPQRRRTRQHDDDEPHRGLEGDGRQHEPSRAPGRMPARQRADAPVRHDAEQHERGHDERGDGGRQALPAVRNGKPHSSMNAVPANGVVKCDQNPRRVAGCAHDARNPSRRSADDRTTADRAGVRCRRRCPPDRRAARVGGCGSRRTSGRRRARRARRGCRTRRSTRWRAAARRAGSRPRSAPAGRRFRCIWTSTGARCAGNHVAMTRSTLGKTAASPAPMRTRARMPMPTTSANAITPGRQP